MKIAFFCGGLKTGGAERVVVNLSNFFSQENTVTILTFGEGKCEYQLNGEVEVISLADSAASKNKPEKICRIFRLVEYLRKNQDKHDIYIAFLPATSYLLLLFRAYIHCPVIVSVRTAPEILQKSFFHRVCTHIFFPRADGIVFQTEYAKKYFSKIRQKSSIVIPNAIDSSFMEEAFQGTRKKKIVSVGRLEKMKNFSLLIHSFRKICKQKEDFDYDLVIYGEGSERHNLEKLIEAYGLQRRVFLPGKRNNVKDEIKDASLFVMSSQYEGMPNALIEAMALGLPVICTRFAGGAAEELIRHGYNGILVHSDNCEELAEAIMALVENPLLCQELGKNARAIVELVSPKRTVSLWEEFIRQVREDYLINTKSECER